MKTAGGNSKAARLISTSMAQLRMRMAGGMFVEERLISPTTEP